MGTIRRSRTARPHARASLVTERDLELLYALGRMRVATTSQLRVLFFGVGRTGVSRRLAKLVALGLIRVHVPSLNAENLYSLGDKGAALLVDEGVEASSLHTLRSLERPDPHLWAINEVRVALVLAERARPAVATTLFLADHDLRRTAARQGHTTPAYVPDALVELSPEGQPPVRLVLEYETGTQDRAKLRNKIKTTVALWREGQALWGLRVPWRPVVIAATERRLHALAQVIIDGGGGDLWLLCVLDRLRENPFGAVFALAREVAAVASSASIRFPYSLVASGQAARGVDHRPG